MGTLKTRATLQGTDPGNINNPDDGIVGTNLTRIQAIELNRILDDMIESAYNKLSDTADDIAESASRKFLNSSSPQDIAGVKRFFESALFQKGLELKELGTDSAYVGLKGNSALGSTYILKMPATSPAIGQTLKVLSGSAGTYELQWSSSGTSEVVSGTANRIAVYPSTGTSVSDQGGGSSLGTKVILPPLASKTYSIPSVDSSDFVMGAGNQSISGEKYFTGTLRAESFRLGDVTISDSNDSVGAFGIVLPPSLPGIAQYRLLVIGPDGKVKYAVPQGVSGSPGNDLISMSNVDAYTYGIGLTPANEAYPGVLTTGFQKVGGEKEFVGGASTSALKVLSATNRVLIQYTGVADYTLSLPSNAGLASQVLTTDGSGNLSWTTPSEGSTGINPGTFGRLAIYSAVGEVNDDPTLGIPTHIEVGTQSGASARAFRIPSSSSAASAVQILSADTDEATAITGNRRILFNQAVTPLSGDNLASVFKYGVYVGGNALAFGNNALPESSTATVTLKSLQSAGSYTASIPNLSSNSAFVMDSAVQSISGAKTFSSGVAITSASNQLVLGSPGQAHTINAAGGISRTYSIPDAGANAEFVLSSGSVAISGGKSFSNLSFSGDPLHAVSGRNNDVTLSSRTNASADAWTLYLPSFAGTVSSADIVATEGSQTINGTKTFTGAVFNTSFTLNANASVANGVSISPAATQGMRIGTAPNTKLGFFGATPVDRPTTFTAALSALGQGGAPVSADYLISEGINVSAWGFATKDEFETFVQVVRNIQTIANEIKSSLTALGLIV